jgi:hypothetical protein
MTDKPSPISGSFSLYDLALRIWKGTEKTGVASANSRASLDRAQVKSEVVEDLAPSRHRVEAMKTGPANYDSRSAIKLAISLNLTDDQLETLLIVTQRRRKAMIAYIKEELAYRRRQELSSSFVHDGSANTRH